MELWNKHKAVPEYAQKQIGGGRLKGLTDISPQWRFECLTEMFGPVGIGWWTKIVDRWVDQDSHGQASANVIIELHYMLGEKEGIVQGEGGSMLIAQESKGLYFSDEAWKMAKTDALSVCCKQLGIGSDIYMGQAYSKYLETEQFKKEKEEKIKNSQPPKELSHYEKVSQEITNLNKKNGDVAGYFGKLVKKHGENAKLKDLTEAQQTEILEAVRTFVKNEG